MQRHKIEHHKLSWDQKSRMWVVHISTVNYYLGEHYSAIYLPYIMEEFRGPAVYVKPTKLHIITEIFDYQGMAL